jgi:hypothetical protein
MSKPTEIVPFITSLSVGVSSSSRDESASWELQALHVGQAPLKASGRRAPVARQRAPASGGQSGVEPKTVEVGDPREVAQLQQQRLEQTDAPGPN